MSNEVSNGFSTIIAAQVIVFVLWSCRLIHCSLLWVMAPAWGSLALFAVIYVAHWFVGGLRLGLRNRRNIDRLYREYLGKKGLVQ